VNRLSKQQRRLKVLAWRKANMTKTERTGMSPKPGTPTFDHRYKTDRKATG